MAKLTLIVVCDVTEQCVCVWVFGGLFFIFLYEMVASVLLADLVPKLRPHAARWPEQKGEEQVLEEKKEQQKQDQEQEKNGGDGGRGTGRRGRAGMASAGRGGRGPVTWPITVNMVCGAEV